MSPRGVVAWAQREERRARAAAGAGGGEEAPAKLLELVPGGRASLACLGGVCSWQIAGPVAGPAIGALAPAAAHALEGLDGLTGPGLSLALDALGPGLGR